MKNTLNFVKHGIINRQFEEQLTQVHFCGDRVQSFNGIVTMSHPCHSYGSFSIESAKILKAFEICDWDPAINLTDNNVIIKRGDFRLVLPYSKEYEYHEPTGGKYQTVPEDFLDIISEFFPFISEDASRKWSQSMLVEKKHIYVTNNIILLRQPIEMLDCVIPGPLLSVLNRIKDEPKYYTVDETSITFFYGKHKWVSCLQLAEKWPDVKSMFDWSRPDSLHKLNQVFLSAFNQVQHFCDDDIIKIRGGYMTSGECSVKIPGRYPAGLSFSCSQFKKIIGQFNRIGFDSYPKPMYVGDSSISGYFMGMMAE